MNQQFTIEEQPESSLTLAIEEVAGTEKEMQSDAETVQQSAMVEQMASDIRLAVGSQCLRSFLYILGLFALIQGFALMNSVPASNSDDSSQISAASRVYLLLVVLCAPFAIVLSERKYRRRTHVRTGGVDTVDDPRMVGPLAEMLAIESLSVRKVAKEKLTRLLPKLNASDSALLDGAQRKQLNRFIRPDLFSPRRRDIRELFSMQAKQRDIDFQLAIFKAYEQVGDSRSIKAVRSVAYPPYGPRSVPQEVYEGALRCLTFLEMAVEKETFSKQLLRPSSASEVMPDMLLRPAMHQPTAEQSDSLLRGTNVPNEK